MSGSMFEVPLAFAAGGRALILLDSTGGIVELWAGQRCLAATCHIRDSWFGKARGLLGRGELGPGEVMLLTRCRSIHTLGMRFPIDVIYASTSFTIVGIREKVLPWRNPRGFAGCHYVIEAGAGSIENWQVAVGDQLELRRAGDERV